MTAQVLKIVENDADGSVQMSLAIDPLTGLYSRSAFFDLVANLARSAAAEDISGALAILDISRFSGLNFSFGLASGDSILESIGARLNGLLDTFGPNSADHGRGWYVAGVGRHDGDRFLVAIDNVQNQSGAKSALKTIVGELTKPVDVQGVPLRVFFHAGLAVYPEQGTYSDLIFLRAIEALYRAKSAGNREIGVSTKSTDDVANDALSGHIIHAKLTEALAKSAMRSVGFSLNYQPKFDANTREITGAEALVRWHHPELGLIPPEQFIPIAENSGLIHPLGEWIFSEVCQMAKTLRERGSPIPLAVNVSARQIASEDFISRILAIVDKCGCNPGDIDLEITESEMMSQTIDIMQRLKSIRYCGLGIAVDDFGTGFSNFSALDGLQADTIKIDRSLISSIETSDRAREIFRGLIQLVATLGYKTVVEGVESEAQARIIQECGGDTLQGYLLNEPLSEDDFLNLLTEPCLNDKTPEIAQIAGENTA